MSKSAARLALALVAAASCASPAFVSPAWAWGAMGHRLIGQAAAAALPADVPAFLRTPLAIEEIGELAREPDRSKGYGQPYDRDEEPAHFLDLDDDGKVNGGPALAALPPSREAYDTALRAVDNDQYKAGYLPYAIEDGYEQLLTDFRYWRVETAALKTATGEDRTWLQHDRTLREVLILRDLGVWAHFVGDGSQPMHVTVHFNGWGPGPNPHNYTTDHIHGPFEGPFVYQHVTLAAVQAAMKPYAPCAPVATCTAQYLAATNAKVEPLYQLWGTGAFQSGGADAVAFTTAQVARGADELRDLVVDAWTESADGQIGYPKFSVKDALAGKPVPMASLKGTD